MTQEEKNILLKDLSARLPYGVIVRNDKLGIEGKLLTVSNYQPASVFILTDIASGDQEYSPVEDVKPYLRPMSSMTEEEQHEYDNLRMDNLALPKVHLYYPMRWHTMDYLHVDWLNAHHFDYRGLIEKGLALEAPADMYKNE